MNDKKLNLIIGWLCFLISFIVYYYQRWHIALCLLFFRFPGICAYRPLINTPIMESGPRFLGACREHRKCAAAAVSIAFQGAEALYILFTPHRPKSLAHTGFTSATALSPPSPFSLCIFLVLLLPPPGFDACSAPALWCYWVASIWLSGRA